MSPPVVVVSKSSTIPMTKSFMTYSYYLILERGLVNLGRVKKI